MSDGNAVQSVYDRLMAAECKEDAFDRHVLACILSSLHGATLLAATGLDRKNLAYLLQRYFPDTLTVVDLVPDGADPGHDAIEEGDYRRLLLDGRNRGDVVEEWLARIVARRSMAPEHMWRSLGFHSRDELSKMLYRHFPKIAERNVANMRWKKFFYREMCQAEGVYVCKSPVCESCASFGECFGLED